MAIPCRGVEAIKTLAAVRGTGVHSNERHVHLFQIACLELERSRRRREIQAALKRMRDIESRLGEIGALIRKHSDALSATGHEVLGDHAGVGSRAAPGGSARRRTLRY